MTTELLALCDVEVAGYQETINMPRNFPQLFPQCPSDLILPIQDSMTVTPPATSTLRDTHKPFPVNAPTFTRQCFTSRPFELMNAIFFPQSFKTKFRSCLPLQSLGKLLFEAAMRCCIRFCTSREMTSGKMPGLWTSIR
jgi:hypothetical protein